MDIQLDNPALQRSGDRERTIVAPSLEVNVRANTPLTDLIRSGFAAFTTIDGMPTAPASLRIGLGAKWKNSDGACQVSLPNGMTLAGTQSFSPPICPLPFWKPVSAASSFTLVFRHSSAALWTDQVEN